MLTRNIHLGRNVKFGGPRGSNSGFEVNQNLWIAGGLLMFVTAAALLHPHPLGLPLLSVALVLVGFALAGVVLAWRFFGRGEGVPARPGHLSGLIELSALIVFFGFAAAILGDPDAAVQSLQAYR
ncbi:MAG: hypothetical protein ABL904_03105 [Hyphomicrobiaceae bacterium]